MSATPTPGFLREYSEFSEVSSVAWSLNRQGYSEEAVKFTVRLLKGWGRACCLDDPEGVKVYVAEASALIEEGLDYVCDVEGGKDVLYIFNYNLREGQAESFLHIVRIS